METMLKEHDVWGHVMFGFAEPHNDVEEWALNNAEKEQWKKDKRKNAQVLLLIQQGVDRAVFQKIIITSIANEAWETLDKGYQGMAKANIVKLHNTTRHFESI